MATLQLNYERSPINDRARGVEKLELNKDYPPRLPADIYDHIVITGILSLQQNSSVYVGYYKDEASNDYYEGGRRLEIVLKIGDINRIQKEAKNYETMKDLQGHSIPRMFAFYEAYINKKRWMSSSDMYGCIVMERFGDSVKFLFYLLEWEDKYVVIDIAIRRPSGLGPILTRTSSKEHHTLSPSNEFRLIDFGDMIEEHPCKLVHHNKPFDFRNASPYFDYSVYSLICRHVSVVADDMNFWDEGFQIVHGLELPKEGLPSNKMMHALFPMFFIAYYKDDDAKVLIEAYFRKIYNLMQRENLKDDGQAVAIIRTHTKQFAEEVESEFSHRNFSMKRSPVDRESFTFRGGYVISDLPYSTTAAWSPRS